MKKLLLWFKNLFFNSPPEYKSPVISEKERILMNKIDKISAIPYKKRSHKQRKKLQKYWNQLQEIRNGL